MSPLFGKNKKPSSIAVLDIESGSFGSAIVELDNKKGPRLMGQERSLLAPRATGAHALLQEIEKEIEHSLSRLSLLSQHVREHLGKGDIDHVAVFLHAPWSGVSLVERAKPEAHEETLSKLRGPAGILDIPVTFHSFSTTTTPIVYSLFGKPEDALVVSIGGEVAEISLLKKGTIAGYATVPSGLNTLLRTLEAHGGMSRHEALSVLSLSRAQSSHAWAEALAAGVERLAKEIKSGAGDLLSLSSETSHVFVLSREPSADVLARGLSEDQSMHELFKTGSTVRAVLPRHAAPHLSLHPSKPDVALMLESLFVDTRFGA